MADFWKNLQKKYTAIGKFSVAAPLSSTPLSTYAWIVENFHEFENWEKLQFVLMDEMLEGDYPHFQYVSTDDSASYEGFARRNFLTPLGEKTGITIPVIKPKIEDLNDFHVGIDLLILALGVKGNYANVMPGTPLSIGWHIAHLIPEFRQAHTVKGSNSYEGATFREYGMSLGPQQVLNAKYVIVIISGKKKRGLSKQLLSYNAFDPEFPLSIIYHPSVKDRVQIFLTEDVLG